MTRNLVETIRSQSPVRLALGFGIVIGGVTVVIGIIGVIMLIVPSLQFRETPIEMDFQAYYFAAQAFRDGEQFIGWAITENSPITGKAYVYPPVTIFAFVFYTLLPEWYVAFALHTAILFGAFFLAGRLSIQYIESYGRELEPIDKRLILVFFLFSGPTTMGYLRGNIDPIILLLIVAGYLALEGNNELRGGMFWALAAMFKFFPAFLGLWMLYRRTYRAIAAATITGVGLMLIGVAIFGVEMHVEFFEFILTDRSRTGAFSGGLDPEKRWFTLRRPLSQFLALSGTQLLVVSALLLGPVIGYLYLNAETRRDRLVAFFGTYIAVLIGVVPATAGYVVYFIFPLVPLLYLVSHPKAKACFIAGLVLIQIPIYPHDIHDALAFTPLPSSITGSIDTVVYGVLSYGSVILWGCLLMLLGCVLYISSSKDGEKNVTQAKL